ncbi:MAG: prolyl oligopeptidase family serine peptidase [Rhodothermaceae bacterium]
MKNFCRNYFYLLLIPLFVSCAERESLPDLIPVEDFFKNSETMKYSLSPDGNYIAFLKGWNNKLNVHVRTISGEDTVRISSCSQSDVVEFAWINNKQLVYYVAKTDKDEYNLVLTDINNSNEKIIEIPNKGVAAIIDVLPASENEILIKDNSRDNKVFDVYRLNLITGKKVMTLKNPGNYTHFIADHNGVVRLAIATDGVREAVLHRYNSDEKFTPLKITNFKNIFIPQYFTADNKNIFAISNIGRDKKVIVEYDIENNEESRVIYENKSVDVDEIIFSYKRMTVVGAKFSTWKRETVLFDKELKYLQKDFRRRFKGYNVELVSADRNENYLITKIYNDKTQGKYYLYDVAGGEFTKLADVAPWIKEKDMADMEPVSYLAEDNKLINGYLVLPKNVEPKNLPTIVYVHGGPWLRVEFNFNKVAQFFANRGYAVLLMNYRGSTGYGKKFWTAGFKQWGQDMQEDVTSGVKWLVDQNISDPDRIGIMGFSYGGYSALMGLIDDPELYACGISVAGVTDLLYFLESVPPYWEPFRKMLGEMIGDPYKDKEMLIENSPVHNIKRINAPLFLAYGAQDSKVNIRDIKKIELYLKSKNIPVDTMIKENETHGFKNQENKIELFNRLEKFVKLHLGRAR